MHYTICFQYTRTSVSLEGRVKRLQGHPTIREAYKTISHTIDKKLRVETEQGTIGQDWMLCTGYSTKAEAGELGRIVRAYFRLKEERKDIYLPEMVTIR